MALAGPLVGKRIAGYAIDSLLGRGGMSEVYAARDPNLQRDVAIKILSPQLATSEAFRDRFLRESRLAASLDHPHIVPIYEAGETEDFLYIVMRKVGGADLGSLIANAGRLSVARALRIVTQVGSALDVAHARGLIHRDVKPANILVERRAEGASGEHAYLSDFGLTKSVGSDSRYTETGQLIGSVHYMSPEQIEGKPVAPRADLYSLGCVLFEALTGSVPYDRDSDLSVLWAHVNAEIPAPTSLRFKLASGFDDVIARALAKTPEDRYATSKEMLKDLNRVVRGRSVRSHAQPSAVASPVMTGTSGTGVGGAMGIMRRMTRRIVTTAVMLSLAGSTVMMLARATGVWDTRAPVNVGTPLTPDAGIGRREDGEARRPKGSSGSEDGRTRRSTQPDRSNDVIASFGVSDRTRDFTRLPSDTAPVPETVERTIQETYSGAAIDGYGEDCLRDQVGCVFFNARSTERFVHIEIEDASGEAVKAWVRFDVDGDGDIDGDWKQMCERTSEPLRIVPGTIVNVMIQTGDCDRRPGSIAPAGGTVTATFFNRV